MRKQIFTLLTLALLSTGFAWATDYGTFIIKFTNTPTQSRTDGKTGNFFTYAGSTSSYYCAIYDDISLPSDGSTKGALKLDGNGSISFTTKATSTITIVQAFYKGSDTSGKVPKYDGSNLDKNSRVDTKTDDNKIGVFTLTNQPAGLHTIVKGDGETGVLYVKVEYTAAPSGPSDPVFSLTESTITTSGTSQIQVASTGNLGGITLSNISYGTTGIVSVDATTGVVSPIAPGTTTITFDSDEVEDEYNASTGNELTISVVQNITVFNANGISNQTSALTKELDGLHDYLSVTTNNWTASQTIDGYTGEFYNMSSSDRQMTIKVTGASSFEVFVKNNTAGRKYAIKVGSADVDSITHGGTNVESSGLFTIADPSITTTITLSGGGKSVYPAYVVFNPAAVITPDHAYVTYVTEAALDFTDVAGLDAYVATGTSGDVISLTEVGAVPAGTPLLLHGTASTTYNVPVVASASAPATNLLVAGTGADINSASKYVLSFQDPNYVFAATNEQAATVPEGKAYLDLSGANAPSVIRIVENTTNIMNVNDVENAVKFIENGKLYIKKNGVTYNVVGAVVK